jgi:hypothetical protein
MLVLALSLPLCAQESKTENEDGKDSTGKRVVRTLQDLEWRKFDAAHRRAHSKRGEGHTVRAIDKRREISKKHKIRQVVRLAVVGGLAYYIGYQQGEKHFKDGMKRKPYYGDRK